MKKKILIGSIIAVVILTLVSFSSVVGYNSVESDPAIASPLFSIKNNRGEVSSNYLSKGKAINILLPKRNDNVNTMYRMIDFISKANDRTFDRFLDLVNSRLGQENDFSTKEIDEIVEQCRYIREYPDEIKSAVAVENAKKDVTPWEYLTFSDGSFPLFCYTISSILYILQILYLIIALPFFLIIMYILMHTAFAGCYL